MEVRDGSNWLSFMNGALDCYESNCAVYNFKIESELPGTCCVYTDGNAAVIKTEVDCSDITESQDAQTSTGIFGL